VPFFGPPGILWSMKNVASSHETRSTFDKSYLKNKIGDVVYGPQCRAAYL